MSSETETEFFADLTNGSFNTAAEEVEMEKTRKMETKEEKEMAKQAAAMERERLKFQAKQEREAAKLNKKANIIGKEESEIFSNEGSEILGKDRRMLLNKVQQYKELFKADLKGFKVKKSATVEELKAYIDEMENIVNTSNVDEFLLDGILASIKMVEGVSAMTKTYNVSGLSDMLKANPHFHSLAKQLFLKYGVFSATPPEYQMLFLVATTAYICRSKNLKKDEMMAYLNEPIPKNVAV